MGETSVLNFNPREADTFKSNHWAEAKEETVNNNICAQYFTGLLDNTAGCSCNKVRNCFCQRMVIVFRFDLL